MYPYVAGCCTEIASRFSHQEYSTDSPLSNYCEHQHVMIYGILISLHFRITIKYHLITFHPHTKLLYEPDLRMKRVSLDPIHL